MTIRERSWRALSKVADAFQVIGIQGIIALLSSFALSAWAVWAADIFAQYSPASWVAAGFLGAILTTLVHLGWQWAGAIRVRTSFNEQLIERGSFINPLERTFEKKRILLNEFALPSDPFIQGKTFVDCDIVGPACIYFHASNQATEIRPPRIDAVWLGPTAEFRNGFIFNGCIFRNCSFQRITIFASIENFDLWNPVGSLNWIGISPARADVEARKRIIDGAPPLIEDLTVKSEPDEQDTTDAKEPEQKLKPI